MKTEHKTYVTLGLVAVAIAGVALGRPSPPGASPAPTAPARTPPAPTLPNLALDSPAVDAITKIELTQPDWVDEEAAHHAVVLERQDHGWEITAPIRTRASRAKVDALLDNLRALTLHESLAGTDVYDSALGEEDRAVHVVAWRGGDRVRDLSFGRSDARGQLVRVAGHDAVFVLGTSGPGAYTGFLYTRGVRSWREPAMISFEELDVVSVEVTNPSGRFAFARSGGGWQGSLTRRRKDGALADPEPSWPAFDASKVEDLLHAYRALAADDYGDPALRGQSGVDDAESSGGVVRIRLRPGESDRVVRVGRPSTNTGRWAIKGSRWAIVDGGDGTLYAMAPWTADWATAAESRFESAATGTRSPPRR